MADPITRRRTILIVDDDRSVIASLALLLRHAGFRFDTASTPAEALERLASRPFDLVLQDMNFSRLTTGEEGLELLGAIKARWPALPVVLVTAWGSISLAVRGVRAGAADFVTKPWSNQQLQQTIETALALAESAPHGGEQALTRDQLDALYDLGGAVGEDPQFLAALDIAGRVAPTDASVLITGESGTGKEVLASLVHRNSRRASGPFVKVNLGGISSSLFESEMFGHVRGAFTDAHQPRKGRFELAHGGTIFLDEVGDLDPSSQVKLLRVLQDRTFEVLGSSTTRTVDVRVVSATNRPLDELVARGDFREDLLYRLNLITIRLPALRERPGDIPRIAADTLRSLAVAYRRPGLRLSERATAWLRTQSWPGNVRELRHAIERAVLVTAGDTLDVGDLRVASPEPHPARQSEALPNVGAMTLDEIERAMIVKSLKHHGGNITKVAESLGLSRAALYRRFEKYGIEI